MSDDLGEELSKKEEAELVQLILEEAYYNSYLVVTERMTFDELLTKHTESKEAVLVGHDPDEKVEASFILSMIKHFSSPEQEEYEKCAELLKRLHLLYPETGENKIAPPNQKKKL